MSRKVYVTVLAEHLADGRIKPLSLTWEDGHIYMIDRVLDVSKAASLKGGGWGMRYTCRILGQERYLWDENGRWFVEGK